MLLGIPAAGFKTWAVTWERGMGDLDLGLPPWGKVCFSARMTEFENNKSEVRSGASPRVKSSNSDRSKTKKSEAKGIGKGEKRRKNG